MTEWLNQYEKVAQRQQQYLQKIRDLRQRLQTKDERYMMLSIERMRNLPRDVDGPSYQKSPEYKSHVPWSSSLLAHSFYPKLSAAPSPRQQQVDSVTQVDGPSATTERGGSYACVIAGERLQPKQNPKHLSPIHSRHGRLDGRAASEKLTRSDMTLERNKTDYEPIEDIARRNRIQFSRYLSSRDEKDEREKKAGNSGKDTARDLTGRLSVLANAGDVTQRDVWNVS